MSFLTMLIVPSDLNYVLEFCSIVAINVAFHTECAIVGGARKHKEKKNNN